MAGVKRDYTIMATGTASQSGSLSPRLHERHQSIRSMLSSRTSSASAEPIFIDPDTSRFKDDASLVLVGLPGSGKSTLAVIASSALKRKILDLETVFHRLLDMPSSKYKQKYGSARCASQQLELLQEILHKNPRGCIVVCSWMDRDIECVLRAFTQTNPVVHVLRDREALQSHLKVKDESRIDALLQLSSAFFRTCTNFEFFNVSETNRGPADINTGLSTIDSVSFLTLKRAERHFLKFLSLIYTTGTMPFNESMYPLAGVAVEERDFTYAVSVSCLETMVGKRDFDDLVIGADAIQIEVNHWEDVVLNPTDAASKTSISERVSFVLNDITKSIGVSRRSTVIPILLHIPLSQNAGHMGEQAYRELFKHALRLAPEYITADLRLGFDYLRDLLSNRRATKIIGSRELAIPEPWTSELWATAYKKAQELKLDMVRLIRPASRIDDNFVVAHIRSALHSLAGSPLPVTAYNSGALGRPSTCFNPMLTVVSRDLTEGSNTAKTLHPSVTALQATRALYASFVFEPMRLYVFGANVGYSMSPAMHNASLEACGLPHCYTPYSSNSLSGIKHLIQDQHFGGASVGLPFKVEIITLTHSLSRHAQAIGAVNTLIPVRKLKADGSVPSGPEFFKNINRAGPVLALYGENTDWLGIRALIRRGLSPANAVRSTTCGLIIGAGGMARAATYAMLQVGVKNIVIHNRTVANAEKMAAHFKALLKKEDFQLLNSGTETQFHVVQEVGDQWSASFQPPTIIISCIPTHRIGDMPAPDFKVPDAWLQSLTGGVIIELGYKTLHTPLLEQARRAASRGWVAMDGLDLLPEQGFAQFELFTGRRAPRSVMRHHLFKNYADERGPLERPELLQRLQAVTDHDALES